MSFIAVKNFFSTRYGNVRVGDAVPVTGDIAKQMVDSGMIKLSESYRQELREKAESERLQAEKEKAEAEREKAKNKK